MQRRTHKNHKRTLHKTHTLHGLQQHRRNDIVHAATTVKTLHGHKQNDNSKTKEDEQTNNFNKKTNVYVTNPLSMDDTTGSQIDGSISQRVGDILSPTSFADSGDKKATIAQNDGDNTFSLGGGEGGNSNLLETNVMIKGNEMSGAYLPVSSSSTTNNLKSLDALVLQTGSSEEINFLKPSQQQLENVLKEKPSTTNNNIPDDDLARLLGGTSNSNNNNYNDNLKSSLLKSTSVSSDPALSKAITADNAIDSTIKEAIKAQIKSDNELASSSSTGASPSATLQKTVDTVTGSVRSKGSSADDLSLGSGNYSVGDIASIAEEADKTVINKMAGGKRITKPSSEFTTVSKNIEVKNLLENIDDKIRDPVSKFTNSQNKNVLFQKKQEDGGLEVSPNINSLSQSEQDLVSSIDKAVRKKDVATEIATNIMMPTKEDPFSDQTVAPSEQLLDMLSRGKFNEPLPESVLTKLSMYDPNQSYLKEEGLPQLQSRTFASKDLMQVGSELLPVRSIAMNMPKSKPKPFIEPRQLAKAEQLMKTNPYYLAQNNQLLDGSQFRSLDDLGTIGESIFPGHVVNFKQPVYYNRPSGHHSATLHTRHVHPVQHLLHPRPLIQSKAYRRHHPSQLLNSGAIDPLVINQINQLPTLNIKKLIGIHRKNQKIIKTFGDSISDLRDEHNTVDHFVPETSVRLPDEHQRKCDHRNTSINVSVTIEILLST